MANVYKAKIAQPIDEVYIKQFQCVSICSPTHLYAFWLRLAINSGVPLVICEKPVSNNSEELTELVTSYQQANTRILVNYIRRFQPAYIALKQSISDLLKQDTLSNIAVRYHRGFVNNASHAFDLLQFLFNKPINLEKIHVNQTIYDHFPKDPTLSLTSIWDGVVLNVMGLANIQFSHFEIDLYFRKHKIMITDAGKTIRIFEANLNDTYLQPLFEKEVQHNCIKDYMKEVIQHAFNLLEDTSSTDNFEESIKLNQQLIKYINKDYGSTCN